MHDACAPADSHSPPLMFTYARNLDGNTRVTQSHQNELARAVSRVWHKTTPAPVQSLTVNMGTELGCSAPASRCSPLEGFLLLFNLALYTLQVLLLLSWKNPACSKKATRSSSWEQLGLGAGTWLSAHWALHFPSFCCREKKKS